MMTQGGPWTWWRAPKWYGPRPAAVPLTSLVILALLFGACSKGSSASTRAPGVSFHATDFSYPKAAPQTLAAGTVHFSLTNDSKTYSHELWIYPQQQNKLQDLLAQKAAGADVSETDFLQGVAGKIEDLEPGKTAAFDAQLAPGTYEYACFITSPIGGNATVHYTLGMHGTFTVQ